MKVIDVEIYDKPIKCDFSLYNYIRFYLGFF